jgi:hypothetical protein
MHYEETVIDGALFCRGSPDGEWRTVGGEKGMAFQMLYSLTDEQRADLFRHFCCYCGDKSPDCQCWNDE